jgi:hypothetical protein
VVLGHARDIHAGAKDWAVVDAAVVDAAQIMAACLQARRRRLAASGSQLLS